MRTALALSALTAVASAVTKPDTLNTDCADSIRNVSATLAYDAMTYYKGNLTNPPTLVGDLPDPYYWWVAGALWGAMLDYYHATHDTSYNDVVIQALTDPSNTGTNFDYMPSQHRFEEGNDDLAFWGGAVMTAAERNFPQPDAKVPSWLQLAKNVHSSLASRWDSTTCGGGLRWQIYSDNPNGMDYKNSISNAGFFQLSARLARATGDSSYQDWADKIWDWSYNTGFIEHSTYHVLDGASAKAGCKPINPLSFTYTTGMYMYGAAMMANHTDSKDWQDRTSRLVDATGWFFTPANDKQTFAESGILYEAACETVLKCNSDMTGEKGYLARFMWQTAVVQPALTDRIDKMLLPSASAASKSCSGGDTGRACGLRWYWGKYDGITGLGQQMSALEIIQGILVRHRAGPNSGQAIKHVTTKPW